MTTIIVQFRAHEKDPRNFRLVMMEDRSHRPCIEVQDKDAHGDVRWSEMSGMKHHVPTITAAALMKVFEVLPPCMLYPPGVVAINREIIISLGTVRL